MIVDLFYLWRSASRGLLIGGKCFFYFYFFSSHIFEMVLCPKGYKWCFVDVSGTGIQDQKCATIEASLEITFFWVKTE